MQNPLFILSLLIFFTSACTIKVPLPDEPITINLNVKIEHEIVVRVDKELDDIFSEDSDLF